MNCASRGAAAAVKLLLDAGADANATEQEKGQTVLMWAAAKGHAEVVKVLIENGAKVSTESRNGFTPLLFAAISGDVETAKPASGSGRRSK